MQKNKPWMSVRVIKNLADLFFWNPWAITLNEREKKYDRKSSKKRANVPDQKIEPPTTHYILLYYTTYHVT